MADRVDANISDLFFNTDISDANTYADGKFAGYDHAKMLSQAADFLGCLERLNVAVPTAEELVQDFYARV